MVLYKLWNLKRNCLIFALDLVLIWFVFPKGFGSNLVCISLKSRSKSLRMGTQVRLKLAASKPQAPWIIILLLYLNNNVGGAEFAVGGVCNIRHYQSPPICSIRFYKSPPSWNPLIQTPAQMRHTLFWVPLNRTRSNNVRWNQIRQPSSVPFKTVISKLLWEIFHAFSVTATEIFSTRN